ncbi:ATP-dependent Clp protease ATP-binding subunit ClpX [Candidatus Tremblaya phenacola]|uniref:ATP-dependent Clp protease ATP-binding subunit ClpX n=1 Tax=Candidatus Tremblayella phenacoccinincola TaxID=1010676 RepID=A0A2G0V7B8_9PROT|nr:ATP-dependent Clp protease ATP-binding subunit ClpX [Candidatus Tremblaya phenacola]PHN16343.1 ATP-dependent Clp protease ATP-binding subunit ClpX [Candidatus Tremblaya phenacola]
MSYIKVCSFCGRTENKNYKLVISPFASICEICIKISMELTQRLRRFQSKPAPSALPCELLEELDKHVVGQNAVKKSISVSIYNHYKRIGKKSPEETSLSKSNILLVGHTGSGKTLIAQTMAQFLNVPFIIVDATSFTEAGYVGDDVEAILQKLLQTCSYDVEIAQKGIVYIDEIDKLSRRSSNSAVGRDISGEGVQQALLKLLEGTTIAVPCYGSKGQPDTEFILVDTSNILFICGGSFESLEKITSQPHKKYNFGFQPSPTELALKDIPHRTKKISAKDLIKFGLIPELVGRLPIIEALRSLNVADLMRILTEPIKALVNQFKVLLDSEGVRLIVHESALRAISTRALDLETGARGLRSILESLLIDIMYQTPILRSVVKVVLDGMVVDGLKRPIMVYDSL